MNTSCHAHYFPESVVKVNESSSPFLESEVSPHYSFYLPFEKNFDVEPPRQWMAAHWHRALYVIAFYLVTIFGIRAYMQSRAPFNLRKPLIVWNVLLAVFSIMGTCRMLPELIHVLKKFGFTYSVCNNSFVEAVKVTGFWCNMFSYSKVLELGDTLFIVLRKQPLIFLHWYHHISVLLLTWYGHKDHSAPARWFLGMNYFVHAFMYSYYALKAMRFKLPRFFSICITCLQITQMFVGIYIVTYAYIMKGKGQHCHFTDDNAILNLLMYASYFVLFVWYFYNAYISPPTKVKKVD
ncbi:putative fatty acid elongation protein 3 [Trichonephila clavata]|uniref:Elongation of very long chain fatty acids protein n=1 Tax=Trichonephila clavata TaxID=2740835 RepID=A0A8X6HDR3_TRICU|nr:putative fatty acid elongation protein 3 [Trichonephila clavata]